jgi:hypothetical protein
VLTTSAMLGRQSWKMWRLLKQWKPEAVIAPAEALRA